MVKPDIRHNYYADLELPTSASIDDIRKAYRKLALQYHPDRNGGREDEVVPKFQAIQAANEVLGDPINKQKYDNDRRKVGGLHPVINPSSRSSTPSNPYAFNSAWPPPPRRTQPGPYQQPPRGRGNPPPTSAANGPGAPPPSSAGSGADRFSSFPRPAEKKDPAQDRANMFKAWQNMQNTSNQDRQPRSSQPTSQPPPQPPPPPPPNRQRPPQTPRQDPNVPTEEQSRAGMKYKARPPYDPEGADKRKAEWTAFQHVNAGKHGMPPHDSAFNDPRKGGFNARPPAAERPEDLGKWRPNVKVPPQQASGRPANTSPETPISPKTQRRPAPDPLRQFRTRAADDQIPFAEGNRVSTPYTHSFIGEKTESFGEGLRRSYSTRDTSKLSPESRSSKARARSSSPQRTSREGTPQDGAHQKPFDLHHSSEESASDADITGTPEEVDSSTSQDQRGPGTAPDAKSSFARHKKVPTPRGRRFDGTASGPKSPPSAGPGISNLNGAATAAQSDHEHPEMRQSATPNMYAKISPSSSSSSSLSSFSSQTWTSQMFGSYSTSRARRSSSRVPKWAVPSSLNPVLRCDKQQPRKSSYVTAADERFVNATEDERTAYLLFQSALRENYGYVPNNLDMATFLKVALMARKDERTGDALLDRILIHVLLDFETVGCDEPNDMADERQFEHSFNYTPEPEHYADEYARSRSEENVDTTFSPDGWKGQFMGEPDYFAPPTGTSRKKPSPSRRPPNSRTTTTPQARSATMDEQPSTQYEEVQQRPYGSDGTPSGFTRTTPADSGFNKEEWERQYQDSTWAWPPPRSQSQSKKSGKSNSRKAMGTRQDPHLVDDDQGPDGPAMGTPPVDDGDAMDIDDTPPARHTAADPDRGARVYSVPPSEWRQQQEHKHRSHRKSSSASRRSHRSATNGGAKFNASLDDLRDSLAQSTGTTQGMNLNDMSSSLPFQSQPAATIAGDPLLPRDLVVPPVPKPPGEPQKLSKTSWQAYAAAFGEYVKTFHGYNTTLLQHFESREQQAQAQISSGMGWLEATGDTSGRLTAPTGFGTYMRGVKEDEKVRETWTLAWEKHADAIRNFDKVRDRVRRLVVGGMLGEN